MSGIHITGRIRKELLEKVQHRYTKMIINMQDKAYEEITVLRALDS